MRRRSAGARGSDRVRELMRGVQRHPARRPPHPPPGHRKSICNCKAIVMRNLRNFTDRRYLAEERRRVSSLRISIRAISGSRMKHEERFLLMSAGLVRVRIACVRGAVAVARPTRAASLRSPDAGGRRDSAERHQLARSMRIRRDGEAAGRASCAKSSRVRSLTS